MLGPYGESHDRSMAWLKAEASAPVRFLTGRYLLGKEPGSPEMKGIWAEVEDDPTVRDIFSKQKPDGSWCSGGAWHPAPGYLPAGGYTPVSPKYVTTVWMLRLLGEIGYTVEDPRIRKAVEWTLGWQLPNGVLTEDRRRLRDPAVDPEPRNVPCRMAIMTSGLAAVGAAVDPRVRKSLDVLVRWQRGDGGWLREDHLEGTAAPYKVWDRSCPWVTGFAASTLYHAGLPEHRGSLIRALRWIVWHMELKKQGELRHLFYRGHDTVRELEMLTTAGVGFDSPAVRDLLGWISGMYDPEKGHFVYTGKPLRKYSAKMDGVAANVAGFRAFQVAEPDWLTLRALRIEKNIRNS